MRALPWLLLALLLLSGPARPNAPTVPLFGFRAISSFTNVPISIPAIPAAGEATVLIPMAGMMPGGNTIFTLVLGSATAPTSVRYIGIY